MTKRQREQVVELLRCAADLCWTMPTSWPSAMAEAAPGVGVSQRLYDNVFISTWDPYPTDIDPVRLLEAAARVEEGSWP